MNQIKLKIVGIDELSQSLLVSFSSPDKEPEDTAAYAFQPHFFGDLDRDTMLKTIAASGVTTIQSQQKLDIARLENKVNSYSDIVGTTMEISIDQPNVVVAQNVEDHIKVAVREVLLEEGLIQ